MKEYIERDVVLKHLDECRGTPPEMCYSYPIFTALKCFVEDIPAADVVEVRHAKWEFDFELADSNFYRCSECNRQEVLLKKLDIKEECPYCHCGAKMDHNEIS